MGSLTTFKLNCAVLGVVREALELHVAQDDSLEPVVELHLPRVQDPYIGRVPCGPHQSRVPAVLDKNVGCPNMVREEILSINYIKVCDIGKIQTIILKYTRINDIPIATS